MSKVTINNVVPPKEYKQKQRQAKLAVLAEKKATGKLMLEDVDAKLDIVLELLEELLAK